MIRPRTLIEYGQLIWRRKILCLFVVLLVLVSAFVVIAGIPAQYQSSGSVVVAGRQDDRQAIAARVATITERLNSRVFLESLIARHGLYPKQVENGAMAAAVNQLRRDIKVDVKYRGDNPEVLTITCRYGDPAVAKDVATDLVSTFGKMNDAVERQVEERGSQIDAEVIEIERRMNQLAASSARSRVLSGRNSAFNATRAHRIAASSSIETLSDKQYSLERQIGLQKQQIAEQEKIARTAPTDGRSGGSYGVLLVRKAELDAQLKDYSSQYTEKNPKVIQARNQLSEIGKQIAQLNAATGQDGVPLSSAEARELRTMQRDLSRTETELEITKREFDRKKSLAGGGTGSGGSSFLASRADAEAPIANIGTETDKDRLRDRYNTLLRQKDDLQQARIAAAGLDPGLFQIIDIPAESRAPAGPDRWKMGLIGLGIALAAGILVVAIVELPRFFLVNDERDVRYYLGAPVMAQIPDVITTDERARRRKLLMARTLALGLTAFLLVPALIVTLNGLGLFQLLANRW